MGTGSLSYVRVYCISGTNAHDAITSTAILLNAISVVFYLTNLAQLERQFDLRMCRDVQLVPSVLCRYR